MPKKRSFRGCLIAVIVTAAVAFVGLIGLSILAGVAMPTIGALRKKFKAEQTRTLPVQLANSVKNYYTEYSQYPLPEGSVGAESTPIRTDARLTATLRRPRQGSLDVGRQHHVVVDSPAPKIVDARQAR